MKKTVFLKLTVVALIYFALLGFVLPFLFSAQSDAAVIGGIIIILAMIYFFLFYIIPFFKNLLNKN